MKATASPDCTTSVVHFKKPNYSPKHADACTDGPEEPLSHYLSRCFLSGFITRGNISEGAAGAEHNTEQRKRLGVCALPGSPPGGVGASALEHQSRVFALALLLFIGYCNVVAPG